MGEASGGDDGPQAGGGPCEVCGGCALWSRELEGVVRMGHPTALQHKASGEQAVLGRPLWERGQSAGGVALIQA